MKQLITNVKSTTLEKLLQVFAHQWLNDFHY